MVIKRGTLSESYVKWIQSVFDNIIRRNIFKVFLSLIFYSITKYIKKDLNLFITSHIG